MPSASNIDELLSETRRELDKLDARRAALLERIRILEEARGQAVCPLPVHPGASGSPTVSGQSPPKVKVALFRNLLHIGVYTMLPDETC